MVNRSNAERRTDGGPVVLTMNGGSSSLKFSIATATRPPDRILRGTVSGIGTDDTTLTIGREGRDRESEPVRADDHARAAEAVLGRLKSDGALSRTVVVGHRIVHGGQFSAHSRRFTPTLLDGLHALSAIDPDHLPAELRIVETMMARMPEVPQVACFDTTFHQSMPRVSRLLAIPRRYMTAGLERYGFHGLSYTFLMEELARVAGDESARRRVILAHLGAGASLAAVHEEHCIDTTMGFTPTSGIMMATRSGDIDPGVLLWLGRNEHLDIDALDDLVNRRSGLLGVSARSSDMRTLLDAEASDRHAADAVALFCHQARKAVGALAATLGGVETLVFSGGIGAASPAIRSRIGRGLEHLGIVIDPKRNEGNASIISTDSSRCKVRVMVTDEESIIARDALVVLEQPPAQGDEN
ncbi:MAG: acetate/propionate family kinase [Myxococcales bacterium]|jgi:acetate kinase